MASTSPPPQPDPSSPVYYQTQAPALLGGTISLQVLSTIVVIMRFAARRVSAAGLWWDDWLIIPALIMDWGISAASWYQIQHSGFGRHTVEAGGPVTDAQMVLFFKVLMALQIFYFFSSVFFKTSLILLYYRIFGVSKRFRIALYCAETIVVAYFIANLLAAIFECNPVAAYWDHTIPGATCVDTVAFYRWNGVANLLIDFMILTLTIPMIWGLSLKLKQKISVSALFLLGAFVVVASIVRVTTFSDVVATDVSYTLVISSMWSTVEQSVGIICACLPVLPPLIRVGLGLSLPEPRSGRGSSKWSSSRGRSASNKQGGSGGQKGSMSLSGGKGTNGSSTIGGGGSAGGGAGSAIRMGGLMGGKKNRKVQNPLDTGLSSFDDEGFFRLKDEHEMSTPPAVVVDKTGAGGGAHGNAKEVGGDPASLGGRGQVTVKEEEQSIGDPASKYERQDDGEIV